MRATQRSDARPMACYLLSAERPEYGTGNAERTIALRARLTLLNVPWRAGIGQWRGTRESTTVVYVRPGDGKKVREVVLYLLAAYEQEAAVYVTPARAAYLITGPGFSQQRLGYLVARPGPMPRDIDGTYIPALATYYTTAEHRDDGGSCPIDATYLSPLGGSNHVFKS